MKKTLLLIFVFILSSFLGLAQNPSNSLTCTADSSHLQYHWTSPTVWTTAQRTFNSFNANGYLTSVLNLKLNTSNNWENNTLSSFTTSANGKLLISAEKFWQLPGNNWSSGGITNYSYTTTGLLAQKLGTYFDSMSNSWLPWNRTTNTYSNGDLISSLTETYVTSNSSWAPSIQTLNSYDQNHNQIQSLEQSWKNSTNSWQNSLQHNRTFSSSLLITTLTKSWYSNAWHTAQKDSIIYNNNGSINASINQAFLNNNWTNQFRSLCSYDPNGNKTNELVETWGNNGWEENYTYVYFRNCAKFATVGIEEYETPRLCIFPNPSNGKLFIRSESAFKKAVLELKDLTGKCIQCNTLDSGSTLKEIDLSTHEKGIYFYTVLSPDFATPLQGKIIISK
ncbi:hypothetical protein CNR22_22520 [Sphingobacteriaceae bacterium]|nr:hypothetical protein CNR22_22520 [Sphingobacteriaceae bacterium]